MATYQAIWKDRVIAESDHTTVVERNHYFPAEAVRREHLEPSDTHTRCSWKGTDSYYDVVVDGQRNRDAAWYYPNPTQAARQIAGHVAFWRGVKVRLVRTDADTDQDLAGGGRGGWLHRVLRSRAGTPSINQGVDPMTKPLTLTDASFHDTVHHSDRPVLVDFWATWCAPCRFMEPIVEGLAAKYAERVTVAKLDVDANPQTAGELRVMSIPTLILFQHGEAVQRLVGVQQAELLEGLIEGMLAAGAARP